MATQNFLQSFSVNEDREKEEQRIQQLPDHDGALPVDQFTRSLLRQRQLIPSFRQFNKNLKSVSLKGNVKSLFPTRLINLHDFLATGTISLTVPGTCALLTSDPGPPYTDDRACYPNGPFPLINQQISGCTPNSYHGTNCIAATTITWRIRDTTGTTTGNYNAYLFNTTQGTLVSSVLNFTIPTTTFILFTQTSVPANEAFTYVVTGVTNSDITSTSVDITVVRIV